MYLIYNEWFMYNLWKWGEWKKKTKEKVKIEQNKHPFPSHHSIYKMEADCFPASDETENKQNIP